MGFAAEIKEFLGAAKESWKLATDTERSDAQTKYTNVKAAAEQKEMDDPLNQKLKEAKLAGMTARNAQIGRESPLAALQRKALQMQIDAANNPQPYGPAATAPPPNTNYGGKPAIGRVDPDAEPAPLMKKGGLVQKFAVGGVVEDEDLEDDEPIGPAVGPPAAATRSMAPAVGPPAAATRSMAPAVGAPRATEFSAQSRTPQRAGAIPMPRARPVEAEFNPVSDALKYNAQLIQRMPAIGPGRQRGIQALARGANAAPVDDMVQVYRKIDPKGEMGESERNLHALEAVHRFKMNQHDTEGAARTAFQMLQTYKQAATRYAALAKAAMDGGNVDEGIKLALKAYANVPDGNDMKLYKGKDGSLNWEVTGKDENGNPIKKAGGIATPDEIGSAAARLATPGGYENYLVQMSSGAKLGGRTIGAGGAADEEAGVRKPPKPADYKEIKQEQIDTFVEKWNTAQAEKPGGKLLDEKELVSAKNMLYHIRRNNDLTDDQGLARIQTILRAPDPKKGETPAFKVVENKEDKSRMILFPDGGELVIPNSQFGMFKSARLESQEQRKKETADLLEASKPGKTMQALNKADEYFSKIGTDEEGKPILAEALKNDRSGQVIKDAAAWLKNKAVNPAGDLPGIPELAKRGVAAVGSALSTPAAAAPPYDPSLDVNAP